MLKDPPTFTQVAAEGETYYRYGVMLKKVANFYNNMASQVFYVNGIVGRPAEDRRTIV